MRWKTLDIGKHGMKILYYTAPGGVDSWLWRAVVWPQNNYSPRDCISNVLIGANVGDNNLAQMVWDQSIFQNNKITIQKYVA